MTTRRFTRQCMCYYCTGSVLEYREKAAQEKYDDSLEEYELQILLKDQDEIDD